MTRYLYRQSEVLKGNKKCRCLRFPSLGVGKMPPASSSFAGVMVVMDESGRLPLSNSCLKAGVCNVMEGQCLNPNNNMEAAAAASGRAAAGSLLVSVLVPEEARLQLHHPCPGPGCCHSSVQFTLTTTLGYCDMTASDGYIKMVLNAIKFARYIINTHFQIYHSPTQSNPQSVI